MLYHVHLLSLFLLLAGTTATVFAQPPVDSLERRPRFYGAPPVNCIIQGDPYSYTIGVLDSNFYSLRNGDEQLTLAVVEPAGFAITPAQITGPQSSDSVTLTVSSTAVNAPVGNLWIKLAARDSYGRTDTLRYYIAVSRKPAFMMPVTISVHDTDRNVTMSQTLYLGLDTMGDATSGYERPQVGQIDTFYCEYELPPLPPIEIFDARWQVITKNGLIRSIHPTPVNSGDTIAPWVAMIQLGRHENGSLIYQPTISWSVEDAARFNISLLFKDIRGEFFSVNMATAEYHEEEPTLTLRQTGDTIRATLPDYTRQGFQITATFIPADVVERISVSGESEILSVQPNPLRTGSTIRYSVNHRSWTELTIIDLHGRTIRKLSAKETEAGEHTAQWDGTNDAGTLCVAGTYFCRMESDGEATTRRIIVER
jgi:hypothetical protein